jgi:hypothetical protein
MFNFRVAQRHYTVVLGSLELAAGTGFLYVEAKLSITPSATQVTQLDFAFTSGSLSVVTILDHQPWE